MFSKYILAFSCLLLMNLTPLLNAEENEKSLLSLLRKIRRNYDSSKNVALQERKNRQLFDYPGNYQATPGFQNFPSTNFPYFGMATEGFANPKPENFGPWKGMATEGFRNPYATPGFPANTEGFPSGMVTESFYWKGMPTPGFFDPRYDQEIAEIGRKVPTPGFEAWRDLRYQQTTPFPFPFRYPEEK